MFLFRLGTLELLDTLHAGASADLRPLQEDKDQVIIIYTNVLFVSITHQELCWQRMWFQPSAHRGTSGIDMCHYFEVLG